MRAFNKDTLREIKNTKKRFISILLIVLLGVGFFAGIKAASPDMQKTLDKYFDENNVMDLQVTSTMGLTSEDIEEIKNLEQVESVVGSYSKDFIITVQEKDLVVKIHSITEEINKLSLITGNFPTSENECVVEEAFLEETKTKIGDKIKIQNQEEENSEKFLKYDEYTIVGTIHSPLYISEDRGQTALMSGKINYYMYVPENSIQSEVYTESYIALKNIDNINTFNDEYEERVDEAKEDIEEIKTKMEEKRYNDLKDEALKQIEEQEQKLNQMKPYLGEKAVEEENKIKTAKQEVENMEKPKWYILDRNQNIGYTSYSQDSERIANIGKVFPAVFFIIAALISLTTMTRMIEEQRIKIGTLKALGYNKIQIALKYVIYAFIATIVGSLIGTIIGFRLFPKIIFDMYATMYTLPDIILDFNVDLAILGFSFATICTVGATILSCYKELLETPASLMRPKSPKAGKRVLLERIKFIWTRLKFTYKVTIRNLFRYKKRVFMTIIGILGCTALIVAGFGLRDSISNMIPSQYGEIFKYDVSITLKNEETSQGLENMDIANVEEIDSSMPFNMQAVEILDKDNNQDIQLVIPQEIEKIEQYITLKNRKTNEGYTLNEQGIILTEKICNLLDIKEGDIIKIKNADEKEAEVKVIGITANYLMHYMYMSPELYKNIFNEEVQYNTILGKEKSDKKQVEEIEDKLRSNSIRK